jgi:SAM-dependent methyltransferase
MALVLERVSEAAWAPLWVRHQHLARYRWASSFLRGSRVIEAACGTGFGAALLADAGAAQVDGFDLSAEAIQEAQAKHARANVHFEVGDVTHLPVAPGSYDFFVSLETIEHLENDQSLLVEALRVLKPAGRFLCSTPNRALTNPGTRIHDRPFNPHHVREYTQAELEALVRPYFEQIELFGQSFYGTGYRKVLTQVGRRLPGLGVKVHQLRKVLSLPWEKAERHWPHPLSPGKEPEILLAICTR